MASIRKLADGRYQAQFRPVPGGPQRTKTGARRADVQRWLDEQTAAIVTGTYADPRAGRETLASFFDSWAARQVWETGTTAAMSLAVRGATFRDKPMRSITRADVELWIRAMQKQPLAAGTIRTRFSNVRTVLRGAVADRKIGTDPTLGVRLPRVRRAEIAMTIPTSTQVGAWLEAAAPEYRALIALCAFAGLRLGEAAALQLGDVNFLRREIAVRRQVQRANGGRVEIRPPKHGSERNVAAAPGLLELVAQHVDLRGLQGDREAWLFPGERGNPAHQNTVGHAWRAALRRANLEGMVLHDLRHFYASGLIAAGCDVATVQHALGHSSPAITLNTYTHLWPKAEDRTRAAAQGLVDGVLGRADELLTNVSADAQ